MELHNDIRLHDVLASPMANQCDDLLDAAICVLGGSAICALTQRAVGAPTSVPAGPRGALASWAAARVGLADQRGMGGAEVDHPPGGQAPPLHLPMTQPSVR